MIKPNYISLQDLEKLLPQLEGKSSILERDVQTFFKDTTHKGYIRGFGFRGFEISNINGGILYAVPIDLAGEVYDEDITHIDEDYDQKLASLGKRFGVNLRLPYYSYLK